MAQTVIRDELGPMRMEAALSALDRNDIERHGRRLARRGYLRPSEWQIVADAAMDLWRKGREEGLIR